MTLRASPAMSSTRRRQQGFTLVEMLVCLFLLSLVAALGAVLLPMMNRTAERSGALQRQTAQLSRVHDFVRAIVEKSLLPRDVGASIQLPLNIDESHLELVTSLPPGLGKGGLYRVSLTIEGLPAKKTLSLRVVSLRPDGPPASEGILLDDATEMAWSYFDRRTGKWEHRWNFGDRQPDLVRLTVETSQAGMWPPLIAAPLLGGGILCSFDTLLGDCRTAVR